MHPNRDLFMLNLVRILQRTGQGGPRMQGPYDEWVVEVPPELRLGSGGKVNDTVRTAPLRIPHYRGQYTIQYGWYPFNRTADGRRQLGPMGQHVHDLLISDGELGIRRRHENGDLCPVRCTRSLARRCRSA